MAGEFILDNFNGTAGAALVGRTPDTGAAWTTQSGSGSNIQIDSSGDRAIGKTDFSVVLAGTQAPTADYEVDADILYYSQAYSDSIYIYARASASATTSYLFGFSSDGSTETFLAFAKFLNGVLTWFNVGLPFPEPLVSGTSYKLTLRVVGSTITCFFNGTQVFQVTDTSISATGYAGFATFGVPDADAGLRVTSFAARPVVTGGAVIPTDSAAIKWSPYSWKVTSGYAKTGTAGSYVKFRFTGTGLALSLDCSTYSGFAHPLPTLAYSIDGGAWAASELSFNQTQLIVASNLASGTHEAYIEFVSTTPFPDRWTTPLNCVQINYFELDVGGTVSAPSTVRAKNAIWFGDSIIEGEYTSDTAQHDSRRTVAPMVSAGFDAEYGQIAYGGQGWTRDGGNVPKIALSYDKYWAGASRLAAGLFTPAPDYVFICFGTNDALAESSDVSVGAEVVTTLTALRAAAPSAKLFLIVPFNQGKVAAITAGFNTYQATPDASAKLINLGVAASAGLTGTASRQSSDGIHPYGTANAEIATMITRAAHEQLAVATSAQRAFAF